MRPRLSEIAIFTARVEETTRFYEQLLEQAPASRTAETAHFDVEGVTVFIHETDVSRSEDHIAFAVENLDTACATMRSAGIDVRGPDDFPWGRSAYMSDPDGREIEIHEPGGVQYGEGEES